eukprot:13027353-Heterocapsa_arctica.AAC.1
MDNIMNPEDPPVFDNLYDVRPGPQQPAGEEATDQVALKEIIMIPDDVRQQVQLVHWNQGHTTSQTLIRVMLLAEASERHIRYNAMRKCPICICRKPAASFRP